MRSAVIDAAVSAVGAIVTSIAPLFRSHATSLSYRPT